MVIICGANNVGKTNFLRALDLFFSLDKEKFNAETDIPYHIAEGSRGRGYKSEITLEFKDQESRDRYLVTTVFTRRRDVGNEMLIKGKKNGTAITEQEAKEIVRQYQYIFIESSNVDLPGLIKEIVKTDVLSELDRLRRRQSEPLQKLREFFELSQQAVSQIEDELTRNFSRYLEEVDGIDSTTWALKIFFPEFEYLREAISSMVYFTVSDTNNRSLETKGSGIQRIVLLALITYISEHSNKKVIWAIDEPEAFLQPGLQRKVVEAFRNMEGTVNIIITTHSPHFINIGSLENTFLFEATYEEAVYARRPNQVFKKLNTIIVNENPIAKADSIRRHLGIECSDTWHLMPFNILVEGEEDKQYLTALARLFGLDVPNIFVAGGVDKMPAYIEFLKEFTEANVNFIPTVICLLDHDGAGKSMYDQLRTKAQRMREFTLIPKYVDRCDGKIFTQWDYEIEDLIYTQLIFDAVNTILRRKQYSIIRSRERSVRFNRANEDTPILKYISQSTRAANQNSSPLNFEDTALKIFLCTQICSKLGTVSEQQLTEWDQNQPHVKTFVTQLLTNVVE
jgi:predicted ATP-dependent endonuclease of OLD family